MRRFFQHCRDVVRCAFFYAIAFAVAMKMKHLSSLLIFFVCWLLIMVLMEWVMMRIKQSICKCTLTGEIRKPVTMNAMEWLLVKAVYFCFRMALARIIWLLFFLTVNLHFLHPVLRQGLIPRLKQMMKRVCKCTLAGLIKKSCPMSFMELVSLRAFDMAMTIGAFVIVTLDLLSKQLLPW